MGLGKPVSIWELHDSATLNIVFAMHSSVVKAYVQVVW